MRGRFVWRLAVLVGLLFVFVVGGATLLFWLTATALGVLHVPGGVPAILQAAGVLALLLIAGFFVVGQALRRVAFPLADVMEAAGRLAEGNYSVRVIERGPPEVRRLTRAFNAMATRLEAHEDQRRNLLADVTHELQTPLSVIQGNLEGLLDDVYPRDDAHLTPILEEARALATLIEDLRILALAETGVLELHREPTDLSELTHETVAAFHAQAETMGVDMSVEVPPDLPILDIDPARIRQVLTNLITNALQHTPRGGSIRLMCSMSSQGSQAPAVTISVTDTGTGIAPEDLPHIFDRFYKAKDSRGTGLGLAIVRNLIAAHGGHISARSDPGKGTTVRFDLPLEHAV